MQFDYIYKVDMDTDGHRCKALMDHQNVEDTHTHAHAQSQILA